MNKIKANKNDRAEITFDDETLEHLAKVNEIYNVPDTDLIIKYLPLEIIHRNLERAKMMLLQEDDPLLRIYRADEVLKLQVAEDVSEWQVFYKEGWREHGSQWSALWNVFPFVFRQRINKLEGKVNYLLNKLKASKEKRKGLAIE